MILCAPAAGCIVHNLPDELSQAAVEGAGQSQPPPVAQVPVSPYAKPSANAYATDGSTQPPVRPTGSQPSTNEAALQDALAALGDVDPATKSQLTADLRQTDPALWPLMVQTFRAGAAYRSKEPASPPRPTELAAGRTPIASPPSSAVVAAPAARQSTVDAVAQAAFAQAADSAQLPLDALASQLGGPVPGATGGGALPTQALLGAALAEAQRREAEQRQVVPAANVEVSTSRLPPLPDEPAPDEPKPAAMATSEASAPVAVAQSDAWRRSLADSITALEQLTAEPPHSAHEVTRHAWLRMLYLTAGRRDDALKPIPGISAAEQDFWREQLFALAACLDVERQTDAAKRSAEARTHLAKADSRLGETGTLVVRNLAFCREVSSYGVYEKFDEYVFRADDPLILYAEVQNFKSEESSKGFHTALRSSYQILDAQGRRVAENELALTEEYCRNERRDYFLRYFLSVPERIYDGKYTLQLTIVDTLSQKIGTSTIDFTVGSKK